MNEPDILPIIITLNANFRVNIGESVFDAFIRVIACQFVDPLDDNSKDNVFCEAKDLISYIDSIARGRSVVLLIDDLDKLGNKYY